jgi:hypothetical protein
MKIPRLTKVIRQTPVIANAKRIRQQNIGRMKEKFANMLIAFFTKKKRSFQSVGLKMLSLTMF